MTAMAQSAYQDKRAPSMNACRDDLLRKVFWIKEQFDSIEHDYLDEIDRQVRRYTRATTQKIENLTNRDQNTRGNLNCLLNALSRNKRSGALVEKMQPYFQLYEQSFLSERSLWYRKRPGKRDRVAPVLLQDEVPNKEAWEEAEELFKAKYGRSAVKAYMEALLAGQDIGYISGISLADDYDYIMSLLSVMGSDDTDTFYTAEELPGSYSSGLYTIPQIKFARRRKADES